MTLIPPKTPRKQRNEREKLDPAEDHQKHKDPLRAQREGDIGTTWSYKSNSCAYIAQGGHRSTNGGAEVGTREEQDDGSGKEDEEINEDERDIFVDATGRNGLPVDFHGQHGVGVDDALQLKH